MLQRMISTMALVATLRASAAAQLITPPPLINSPAQRQSERAPENRAERACSQADQLRQVCSPVHRPEKPTLQSLLARGPSLTWLEMYTLSGMLLERGRSDEGARWFYIGRVRALSRFACDHPQADGEPALQASLRSSLEPAIFERFRQAPNSLAADIDAALEYTKAHPDPALAPARCSSELASVETYYSKAVEYLRLHGAEWQRSVEGSNVPIAPGRSH